jgi:hypothetical protein
VHLHARSRLLADQEPDVVFIEDKSCPYPFPQTANDLQMTLEAALTNYEVIGASPEERRILARQSHRFGSVQQIDRRERALHQVAPDDCVAATCVLPRSRKGRPPHRQPAVFLR